MGKEIEETDGAGGAETKSYSKCDTDGARAETSSTYEAGP